VNQYESRKLKNGFGTEIMKPKKPDFEALAKDIVAKYEASPFTDSHWLQKTILGEFISIWETSKRFEESRITKICKERGWIK
jgi:hypothetical protein